MEQIEKNTVSAENQLKTKQPIFFENKNGKGKKVLFVGNSITKHGEKEDIGWYGNYGMAASSKEKDYVHLVMKEIQKTDLDAAICIVQAAEWERRYADCSYGIEWMQPAKDFNADIIIMRLIENCDWKSYDSDIFEKRYTELIDYLNNDNAKVILTTGFWNHPLDKCILKIGEDFGYKIVYLGDLGEDESMKAIGMFEHSGVAAHPGDKGMEMIAERINRFIREF